MVFNLVSFVSSTPFHIGFTTRLFINTPPETTKPDKPSMGPDHFGWTTNKMLAAAGATNCGGEQMVFAWISKNVILMIRVRKRIVLWWFQEVALNSIMGVLWEKRTSRYFQAISPKKKRITSKHPTFEEWNSTKKSHWHMQNCLGEPVRNLRNIQLIYLPILGCHLHILLAFCFDPHPFNKQVWQKGLPSI